MYKKTNIFYMAKLLIMAGGMSSRMKKTDGNSNLDEKLIEQANTLPKGMIGVGKDGRPFMDYLLYNAHRAGYNEVLILKNGKIQQQGLATELLGHRGPLPSQVAQISLEDSVIAVAQCESLVGALNQPKSLDSGSQS